MNPSKPFTFHHVSIKTIIKEMKGRFMSNSHSTMYLLKHVSYSWVSNQDYDSHSTMYLLKHRCRIAGKAWKINSHSTMYLLKPLMETKMGTPYDNSHSTMYLLKPNTIKKQYFTMLSYPLFVDLASILGIHFLFFNCIFHFSIFHHIVD